MGTLIILGFIFALWVIWQAMMLTLSDTATRWIRILSRLYIVAAAIAAYFSTFHYIYYADENTRFHGWPIPRIVFQRNNADSPWLDFVGPTIILAYPMNLILYLLIPSIALLLWNRFRAKTLAPITTGSRD